MAEITIRKATREDVPKILEIYAPYIKQTCITFEYDVPTLSEFEQRFEKTSSLYPYFVACHESEIVGYAYASRAFERAAYAWSADLSVYVAMDKRGRGIGKKLVMAIEDALYDMGICNLYAIITGENMASVNFHKKLGYTLAGTLTKSGYKMGRWHDVYFYEKRLDDINPPKSIPGITQTFERT